MRLFRYTCPECNHRIRIRLFNEYKNCIFCDSKISLIPEFLVSQRMQVFFVGGGFGIGLFLGRLRLISGNASYDLAQFFLDLICLWIYAWIFRIIYFQFQSVSINILKPANDASEYR